MDFKKIVKDTPHVVSYLKRNVYVLENTDTSSMLSGDTTVVTTMSTFKTEVVKCGVVVAVRREDGEISVGWSACSDKDIFSKVKGKAIAIRRALYGRKGTNNIPSELHEAVINKGFILSDIAKKVL